MASLRSAEVIDFSYLVWGSFFSSSGFNFSMASAAVSVPFQTLSNSGPMMLCVTSSQFLHMGGYFTYFTASKSIFLFLGSWLSRKVVLAWLIKAGWARPV